MLKGTTLTYYKSERDVHYPPRGEIDLQGTYLEMEGLKRRKHWTFQVTDAHGVSLIRLSTEVQSEYLQWAEALERAGCIRVRQPGGGGCARRARGGGGSSCTVCIAWSAAALGGRGGATPDAPPCSPLGRSAPTTR